MVKNITKKQRQVYEYIYYYIRDNGYSPTQEEIREHFGLKSLGSVQKYIKYLTDANYLGCDWNARRGIICQFDLEEPAPTTNGTTIPLLGDIAAGNPIEAIENPTETIDVPSNLVHGNHKFYALNVAGDSMIEAGILDGDIAICQFQNHANRGDIVVAVVDGEATLKYYQPHSDRVELLPANVNYSPIVVSGGHFMIGGILKGIYRHY